MAPSPATTSVSPCLTTATAAALCPGDITSEKVSSDRIDEIVSLGITLNPADSGWASPALDVSARRHSSRDLAGAPPGAWEGHEKPRCGANRFGHRSRSSPSRAKRPPIPHLDEMRALRVIGSRYKEVSHVLEEGSPSFRDNSRNSPSRSNAGRNCDGAVIDAGSGYQGKGAARRHEVSKGVSQNSIGGNAMRRKTRRMVLAAAGALITGVAASVTITGSAGASPVHTTLTAATYRSGSINLADCPVLHVGYHGGCVDELQDELNYVDNAGLAVDGSFGALTLEAVAFFQAQSGLEPDGMVGPLTKNALVLAQSVPTPSLGASLTPFEVCQAQGGLISDGHGGCTSDGVIAEGKSPSDCINELLADQVNEKLSRSNLLPLAENFVNTLAEKALQAVTVASVFKCSLLDNPDS
jgi:Putative peptidoglycan binding domain